MGGTQTKVDTSVVDSVVQNTVTEILQSLTSDYNQTQEIKVECDQELLEALKIAQLECWASYKLDLEEETVSFETILETCTPVVCVANKDLSIRGTIFKSSVIDITTRQDDIVSDTVAANLKAYATTKTGILPTIGSDIDINISKVARSVQTSLMNIQIEQINELDTIQSITLVNRDVSQVSQESVIQVTNESWASNDNYKKSAAALITSVDAEVQPIESNLLTTVQSTLFQVFIILAVLTVSVFVARKIRQYQLKKASKTS